MCVGACGGSLTSDIKAESAADEKVNFSGMKSYAWFGGLGALVDDRHRPDRGRGRAAPLHRQHAHDEGMIRRRDLVQVAEILEVVVLTLAHDAVRFPELSPLEHLRHRRIEADGVDAHDLDAPIEQVVHEPLGMLPFFTRLLVEIA